MTPEGHVVAGWITFSAYRDVDGVTVAQAQAIDRMNDFIYELTHKVCVDRRLQWSNARNVWHNAFLRTGLYRLLTPLRWFRTRTMR
jgi:hypothetical protein